MDRIPVEVYRLIISMIEDEESPLKATENGGHTYIMRDLNASQSNSNSSTGLPGHNDQEYSSLAVRSMRNMQRMLQDQIAGFRKTPLMTLIRRMSTSLPTKRHNEDRDTCVFRTVNRLKTLKSLRLCNKRLSVNTAEAVFEEVVLHFNALSHSRLEAISQHPYKDYVRVLHIVPKAISGPLLPKKEFGRWLRGRRTLIDDPLVCYAGMGYATHLSMLDGVKISRKAVDFHYAEYSSIHAEQQKLFTTAEDILQTAIGRLPQLKRVESGLYWEWSRRREDIPTGDFEPGPGKYFRVFTRPDALPKDEFIDRVWKLGACQTNFDMDQGTMTLRAIARGKISSGARIDVGPLFRHLNIMVTQIADSEEKAVVNALMADAKHFNFSLAEAELREAEEDMSFGRIVTFLQSMTNLQSLHFRSESLNSEDRIGQAFGNLIMWPHLTRLSITGVDHLDFGGLAALVCRHKAGLRQLMLYDFRYQRARCCNLLAAMHAGTMDKIDIWNRWRRRRLAEKPIVSDILVEHKGWITFRPRYVFSGGTWSPRLRSDLRENLVAKLFPSSAFDQPALLADNDESTENIGGTI